MASQLRKRRGFTRRMNQWPCSWVVRKDGESRERGESRDPGSLRPGASAFMDTAEGGAICKQLEERTMVADETRTFSTGRAVCRSSVRGGLWSESSLCTVDLEDRPGYTLATVSGCVTFDTVEEFEAPLSDVVARPNCTLLIDLSNIGLLDSSGLGSLIRLVTLARTRQSRVALVGLPSWIPHVLKITCLCKFFEVYPNAAEAAASLAQVTPSRE